MMFHQMLAQTEPTLKPLERVLEGPDVAENFDGAWAAILKIDYVPIFSLARDIVRELIGNPGFDDALRKLAIAARHITSRRAALRHDLMGRIYHRLLADAKYFGAYYTTIPAAVLLLRLTLDPGSWTTNFGDIDQIQNLRIADLACGTGTLLKAALESILDNHIKARAVALAKPDPDAVHKRLVEECLWGFDVIPFAIHLAGSTLALHEPEVTFTDMNLRTMPLGTTGFGKKPKPHLGSLEFLIESKAEVQADLLGGQTGPEQLTRFGPRSREVTVPLLELCVMNPPFTRSVGGNLLFGNLPPNDRAKLQKYLKSIVSKLGVKANITAGLGSVFAAMGDKYVKPGGHLSLVIPRALLSGIAWEPTRRLLGEKYHVRYIVVSHEPRRWNFSENTKLSECLIVARKLKKDELSGPTKVVNLAIKPATSVEALAVAELIRSVPGVLLENDPGIQPLEMDRKRFGELLVCPPERIRAADWGEEAAFAHTDLSRIAFHLRRGRLFVPGRGVVGRFPITRLDDLVVLGPDRRDIHDGFRLTRSKTAFAAFWGHETDDVQQMTQSINAYLSPLPSPKKGRKLRDANLLWSRSGRLLLAERLRLNTARAVSILLDRPALANTWWPAAVVGRHRAASVELEKILALWLNSTLGVLVVSAARVDTEGAWVELKKPILEILPILNPLDLKPEQRAQLAGDFDRLAGKELQRLGDIGSDPTRAEIDRALARTLGWSDDLAAIRSLAAAEPLFSG